MNQFENTYAMLSFIFSLGMATAAHALPLDKGSRYYPNYTHSTTQGTPSVITSAHTAIYIRQGGHIYNLVPMSKGRFWARKAWPSLEARLEEHHAASLIDIPAGANPVTLVINGKRVAFESFEKLGSKKGQITPVSSSGGAMSSGGSSSGSGGVDVVDQDETPGQGYNNDDSIPLCQLTGTCAGSSSGSSSSGMASSSSSGGVIIPGSSSGGSIPDGSAPGTLPSAPRYSGNVYFVSPGGSGISTDLSRPGNAVATLRGVDDGSTIKFLPGNYGNIAVNKPKQTGRIKLISTIPVLTGIDTTKRTSAAYATIASQIVKGYRTDGARFGRLELEKFSAPWVEGFYFPAGGGGINILSSPQAWVVRNHVFNSSNGTMMYGKDENRAYVILENWIWNNRRGMNKRGIEDWGMDYAVRLYGSKVGAVYVTKNLILGGFNQPISTKSGFKNTYIENNFFVGGDGKTPDNPGPVKNIMVGQESDKAGIDNTGENVFIRNNTFRGKGRGMIIFNVQNAYVEGNNFINLTSAVSQFFSAGVGQNAHALNGIHPRLTVVKNNWFSNSPSIDAWPRGNTPESLVVEGNTVAGGKGSILLHTTITGDPDRPPASNLVLPSVNRVGGDASGFAAQQTVN